MSHPVLRPSTASRCARPARAVVVVLALIGLVVGCTGAQDGVPDAKEPTADPAVQAAEAFAAAWSEGDLAAAAAATDDPVAAQALLEEVTTSLRIESVTATVVPRPAPGPSPSRDLDAAPSAEPPPPAGVPVQVVLTLADLGPWSYETVLDDAPQAASGEPRIAWGPGVVHPQLSEATRLGRTRTLPRRAPILDADGVPIMDEAPVVSVGIEPQALTDPATAYAVIAATTGVDTDALAGRVTAADPTHFVPVVTLRAAAAAPVREQLDAVPGLLLRDEARTLAPSPSFARGLLGTVGPATAETLQTAGPLAADTDTVGSSGLQQRFETRLAGTPSGEVRLVNRESGAVEAVVGTVQGASGEPLFTTLVTGVQAAAEAALAPYPGTASLVAVRASTGEVLAAANTPATAQNLAFTGRYPPGSSFKVVTSAALLAGGLDPASTVPCPGEVSVNGKRFSNAGDFVLGAVSFRTDFARSCNTAFVELSRGLAPEALADQALLFGLGAQAPPGAASFPGVEAFLGSVPVPEAPVERAAAAIGQGEVLASPLAMAGVAATAATGQHHHPVLLPDEVTPPPPPPALDPTVAAALRELMLAVVQEGSGSALAGIPGVVGAKTGTAEYGTESPPRTHAWMIGFRDDVAFAVILEDGGGGGSDAGPVAAAFLRGLG